MSAGRRAPRCGCLVVALAAAAFGLRALLTGPAPARPELPTIVLVVWDSIARDRLAPYGGAHATTPHLAALAQEAVVYEQHVPTSDGTNAAFASLLTGRLPRHHGVGALDSPRGVACSDALPTLATGLRARGWRTVASLALPQLAPQLTRLGRGFELCAAPLLEPLEALRPARATLEAARPVLEELLATEEPVFVLLHLADVRARRLDELPGAGRWVRERLAPFAANDPQLEGALGDLPALSRALLRRRGDPARAAYVGALYDGAVTAMDAALGELLALLEQHGRRRDALVAVCGARAGGLPRDGSVPDADEPGPRPFAPLFLRLPGGGWTGRSIEPTQDVDLLPTLLRTAGVELPAGLDGRDLSAPLFGAERAAPPRAAGFVEGARFERRFAVGRRALLRESLGAGEQLFALDGVAREPTPEAEDELPALRALLERHPPLGRLEVSVEGGAALRVQASGALLAPVEPGGRISAFQGFELASGATARLRAERGRPDLALRLEGEGLDEHAVLIGARPVAELDLALLADPAAPERADDAPAARCRVERRGGGWSEVVVGVAPGAAARAVVELLPASSEGILDAVEADPGVALRSHPRRAGAVVLEGASPLRFRVRQRPSNEPAFAFFLDGARVPAADIARDGRAFGAPGALRLCLSAGAWSDPALYEPAPPAGERGDGAWIELLDPAPPGTVPAPDVAELVLLRRLASLD